MHVTIEDVKAYLERQSRKFNKTYDQEGIALQHASQLGIAMTMIWDLIMDLELETRIKRIKQIKGKS